MYPIGTALIIALLVVVANAAALQCESLTESGEPVKTAGFDRGMLWRVESPSTTPSYIFGTIHISDPRVTEIAPPVMQAFNNSQRFVMEVLFDPATIERLSQAMILPSGRDLESIIGEEQFAATAAYLQRYGIGVEAARSLKPWAAYMTLSMPPGPNSVPLDLKLMLLAEERNLPAFGLESVDEQIAVFDTLAIDEQHKLLVESLCHYDRFQSETQSLIQTYIDRDLRQMLGLSLKYDLPSQEKFMEVLLWRRNQLMAERMEKHLTEGGAFIAVGALHLPGEGGVLDLLRSRGYTLTSIY